jgi:hypothetical protein
MKQEHMTRKEFVRLTFTLLGGAAAAAACSSSNNGGSNGSGGSNGTGGSAAGTGGSASGTGGTVANNNSCVDPLPETQLPDSTGHTHTVTIPASDLNATTAQMTVTSETLGHNHSVTLGSTELATLRSGGQVTVMSNESAIPFPHTHMYSVSCRPG